MKKDPPQILQTNRNNCHIPDFVEAFHHVENGGKHDFEVSLISNLYNSRLRFHNIDNNVLTK